MTKEEAIKILREDGCGYCTWQSINPYECENKECKLKEALDMAISALEQEPTDDATLKDIFCMGCEYKDAEPCEDAISREAVIKLFNGNIGSEAALILHKVKQLPSVTPSRHKGWWNTYENYQGGIKETWYECSKCKWSSALLIPRKYCPNCGAENERVEDDKRGIFKKSC